MKIDYCNAKKLENENEHGPEVRDDSGKHISGKKRSFWKIFFWAVVICSLVFFIVLVSIIGREIVCDNHPDAFGPRPSRGPHPSRSKMLRETRIEDPHNHSAHIERPKPDLESGDRIHW